ncbi:MAG TPA: M28 family peptidase [Bacteroidales bacterium]|nr:M28 family peptidase [Bacteroidales bacterium]
MRYLRNYFLIFIALLSTVNGSVSFGQNGGLRTITEDELRYHLEFLGANEFRGRETPSSELEIATLYLGNWAKQAGLKTLQPDGSYYQTIPISVSSVLRPNTRLRIITGDGEEVFYYEDSFGGNFGQTVSCFGDVVFAGLGLVNPEKGWDDLKDLDLYGKVVVIMDEQHPDNNFALGSTYSYRLSSRTREIRNRGASAVLVIVNPERENRKRNGEKIFAEIPSGRMDIIYDSQLRGPRPAPGQNAEDNRPARPAIPFVQADISHPVASAILGITEEEIADLFYAVRRGEQVSGKTCADTKVHLNVEVKVERTTTRNVLGLIEGTDPVLKNEYIVICAHHDHLGISDGEIIAGADDNGTGTVALIEIAQALMADPPRRSVIIAWFTGEERGFIGSQYFVNNSIVPVEKINACLNMDMLGRNHTDSLFLVGSDLLSSELDAAIHRVNRAFNINFGFNYLYSNLTHPQRVYFRSDQYPHIRFGIPSVWFFCGFTPDYHTPKDILGYIDYKKMLKVTKLVYLTAFEIGNMKEMLKLDTNPEVTSRGKHNLPVRSLFENTR